MSGSIWRPWRQDERPVWWAWVQHEVAAPLDETDLDAVRKQAHDTGLTRHVLLTEAGGTVSAYLLVKADSAEEAAHVALRVVEAAHREAGHGLLGRSLRRSALPQRAGRLPE